MDREESGALPTDPDAAAVRVLQARLVAAGYAAGPQDGRFGPETRRALAGFQADHGLPADGVAGPLTLAALAGLPDTNASPDSPPASLALDQVCRMFPCTPRPPIAANLPLVLAALDAVGLSTSPFVLAALATIRAEAEAFEPIEEAVSPYNTSPGHHAFNLYDHRRDLGNHGPPDGATYRGRGFVQLTGRGNYARMAKACALPALLAQPALACHPPVAARLLAAFLDERRAAIAAALQARDLARARRLVNGGSNGLDRFCDAYTIGERIMGLQPGSAPA